MDNLLEIPVARRWADRRIRPVSIIVLRSDPLFVRVQELTPLTSVRGIVFDWEPGQLVGIVLLQQVGSVSSEPFILRGHTVHYKGVASHIYVARSKEVYFAPPHRRVPIGDTVFPEPSDTF